MTKHESTLWAFLAYFLSIIGVALVFALCRRDKFAMFHAKQSLVLFFAAILVSVASAVVPIVGWLVIAPVGNVFILILWVIGIVHSFKGEKTALPIIGKYAKHIKL